MTHTQLPGTDLAVSPLCLGLGGFGTRVAGASAVRLLEQFLQAGANFVDTAHCYAAWLPDGAGASERQLGEAIRQLDCRAEIVIATKGGHPAIEPGYPRPDGYLAPEVIAADIDDSLQRLGVETIDLYQLHRDDPRVPVDEIMAALNAEVRRGRVRHLGASNWSVERLAAANEYAGLHALRWLSVSQIHFSLADPQWPVGPDPTMRYLTATDREWHARTRLPVLAYSSSAGGYFAGRAEAGYGTPVNAARRDRARELAAHRGATPTQVALACLRHQPFPVYPIVGTLDEAHLAEAVGAMDLSLTADEATWLREGDTAP